jgi:hypothetical protein
VSGVRESLPCLGRGGSLFRVSNTLQEPLPIEVSDLGNFEARMLRNFQAAVEDWDEVCSALGTWEAQHLTSDDSGQAAQEHLRWLTELVSWGRLVQGATQQPEFPDKGLAARVDARVRHLEDKLSLWHGDMPPAEQDRILQAAFK